MAINQNHALRGKLSLEVATNRLPRGIDVDLPFRPTTRKTVDCYFLLDEGQIASNTALSYAISRFFDSDLGEPRMMESELANAYIMILLNILSPRAVMENFELQAHFRLGGYELNYRCLTDEQFRVLAYADPRWQKYMDTIGDMEHRLRERDLFLVAAAVVLLIIGKQVNPEGYTNWYAKRVRAFAGSIGYKHAVDVLSGATAPSANSLIRCHGFLSATRQLRGSLFRIILAGSRNDNRTANLLTDIVHLLRGAEMNHILLIDKYLYSKYPELRAIRCLRDEHEPMQSAWEFLAQLSEDERFFCKLLRSKEETAPLNRNQFNLYHAAAVAAAKFESPSMKNFKSDDDDKGSKVADIVQRYLLRRLDLSDIAVGESADAGMSEKESIKYFEGLVGKIEDEIEAVQRD